MLNRMLAVVLIIVFPVLEETVKAGPIFTFFALYCSIFLIRNQKLLIETKDKTNIKYIQSSINYELNKYLLLLIILYFNKLLNIKS